MTRLDPKSGSLLGFCLATGLAAACSSDSDGESGESGGTGPLLALGGAGASVAIAAGANAAGGSFAAGAGPVVVLDTVEVSDDTGSFTCYVSVCDAHLVHCGDCEDNDGDGLIDAHDPECLGPCDNTEGPGLYSDVGGAVANSCGVDCYFDYGNGPGNDDCVWDHSCDPLEPEVPTCPYDEGMVGGHKCPVEQSELCAAICLPFTPNGCDCFGCCTFPELATAGPDGGPGYVYIGAVDEDNVSTCTFDDIEDTDACPPCTPVGNCLNDCGPCEVCVGRPLPPPECFETDTGVPEQQCDPGVQPCGLEGQDPCGSGYYCISGCCIPLVQ